MAFPAVQGSVAVGTASTSSITVSLPTGIQAGDLLLCAVAINYTYPTLTFPAGWTKVVADFNYSDAGGVIAYRICDGSEGSSITVSAGTGQPRAWQTYLIRGRTGNPEAAISSQALAQTSNPPNLAPSWGVKDCLWLVFYFESVSYSVTTPPTGYGNETNSAYGGNNVAVYSWYKTATASSDDPAALTNNSPGGVWNRSVTLAVQGAALASRAFIPMVVG